ncbi:MAG: Fis family transcriptional regulator [Chthonomonadaceae bacterium]|nr:Fis family transcriptional regulator [Chthonomonadaceae bacterium]
MKRGRVLVVENDPQCQRLLRVQLSAQEFAVQVIDRGEEALIAAAEIEPDLILLSMSLPGINGLETCRRLREWTRTPIIVLDSKEEEPLRVEALEAGVDDCVAKPFRTAELLARMRAVLRRTHDWTDLSAATPPLIFRNLTVDMACRRVLLDGRPLHLTPTEFELLRILTLYAGRVLTHREILTRIWGPASATDTQYLHVFVSQLRRKLEPHAGTPQHIITQPGIGYQFSAEPLSA